MRRSDGARLRAEVERHRHELVRGTGEINDCGRECAAQPKDVSAVEECCLYLHLVGVEVPGRSEQDEAGRAVQPNRACRVEAEALKLVGTAMRQVRALQDAAGFVVAVGIQVRKNGVERGPGHER